MNADQSLLACAAARDFSLDHLVSIGSSRALRCRSSARRRKVECACGGVAVAHSGRCPTRLLLLQRGQRLRMKIGSLKRKRRAAL